MKKTSYLGKPYLWNKLDHFLISVFKGLQKQYFLCTRLIMWEHKKGFIV